MEDPLIHGLIFDALSPEDFPAFCASSKFHQQICEKYLTLKLENTEYLKFSPKLYPAIYDLLFNQVLIGFPRRNSLSPGVVLDLSRHGGSNLEKPVTVSGNLVLSSAQKVYKWPGIDSLRHLDLPPIIKLLGNNYVLDNNGKAHGIVDFLTIPHSVNYPVKNAFIALDGLTTHFLGIHGELAIRNHLITVPDAIQAADDSYLTGFLKEDGTIDFYDTSDIVEVPGPDGKKLLFISSLQKVIDPTVEEFQEQPIAQDLTGDLINLVSFGSWIDLGLPRTENIRERTGFVGLTREGQLIGFDNDLNRYRIPLPFQIGSIIRLHGSTIINKFGQAYRFAGNYVNSKNLWIPISNFCRLSDVSYFEHDYYDVSPGYLGLGKLTADYFEDYKNGIITDQVELDRDIFDNSLISYTVTFPIAGSEEPRKETHRAWVDLNGPGIQPRVIFQDGGNNPVLMYKQSYQKFIEKLIQNSTGPNGRRGKLYRPGELENNENIFYFVTPNREIQLIRAQEQNGETFPIESETFFK